MISQVLVLVAGTLLTLAVVFFGRRRTVYSHIRNTISELGEQFSKDAQLVNLGVFLPVGILCALSVFINSNSSDALENKLIDYTYYLGLSIATGYIVAAFFPCDPGAPFPGSWRNGIHNLGGGVMYVGAAVSLWYMSKMTNTGQWGWGNAILISCSTIVGLAIIFLSFPNKYRGLVQRVVELLLFVTLFSYI